MRDDNQDDIVLDWELVKSATRARQPAAAIARTARNLPPAAAAIAAGPAVSLLPAEAVRNG